MQPRSLTPALPGQSRRERRTQAPYPVLPRGQQPTTCPKSAVEPPTWEQPPQELMPPQSGPSAGQSARAQHEAQCSQPLATSFIGSPARRIPEVARRDPRSPDHGHGNPPSPAGCLQRGVPATAGSCSAVTGSRWEAAPCAWGGSTPAKRRDSSGMAVPPPAKPCSPSPLTAQPHRAAGAALGTAAAAQGSAQLLRPWQTGQRHSRTCAAVRSSCCD